MEAKAAAGANEDACTANIIGKQVTDGGVCYDEQKKILFKDGYDTKLILEETKAAEDTPFYVSGVRGAVPIVHGDSYIVIDKYVKSKK